jgi:hypothetical protein
MHHRQAVTHQAFFSAYAATRGYALAGKGTATVATNNAHIL